MQGISFEADHSHHICAVMSLMQKLLLCNLLEHTVHVLTRIKRIDSGLRVFRCHHDHGHLTLLLSDYFVDVHDSSPEPWRMLITEHLSSLFQGFTQPPWKSFSGFLFTSRGVRCLLFIYLFYILLSVKYTEMLTHYFGIKYISNFLVVQQKEHL